MGAPPYAGWERRCIVCAHVREDHWLCVSTVAVHGLVGSTHKSAYVASKHGVVGFSKVVSGWAGVRGPCASYASPTLHLSRVALSVPVRVFVHAPCLSSPWRPLARGSPPTAFAQVLCPGAVAHSGWTSALLSAHLTAVFHAACRLLCWVNRVGAHAPGPSPDRRQGEGAWGAGQVTRAPSHAHHVVYALSVLTRTMLPTHSLYSMCSLYCIRGRRGGGSLR
jgi:hypothetical protein